MLCITMEMVLGKIDIKIVILQMQISKVPSLIHSERRDDWGTCSETRISVGA